MVLSSSETEEVKSEVKITEDPDNPPEDSEEDSN